MQHHSLKGTRRWHRPLLSYYENGVYDLLFHAYALNLEISMTVTITTCELTMGELNTLNLTENCHHHERTQILSISMSECCHYHGRKQ